MSLTASRYACPHCGNQDDDLQERIHAREGYELWRCVVCCKLFRVKVAEEEGTRGQY